MKSDLTGREYWLSLEQLAGTPEFQNWVEREFQDDATDMLSGKSRRTVLKLMAASFGLAGLTACRRPEAHILPATKGIEDFIPGQPYFYATAMPFGGTVTGLLVETHDGRPTKIEGNPDHPNSLGAATALAQASILSLYDPDRARQVTHEGRPSSWEAFAKFAAEHFSKVSDGSGLRFLSERVTSPSLDALRKQTLENWPKAKWVEYEAVNDDQALEGARIAFGKPLRAHPAYDKAEVIVSLDADFLGVDSPTPLPAKQFSKGRRIEGEDARLSRVYSVESNYSLTGAAADHRLRMRGSDVGLFARDLAVALGALPWLNVLSSAGKRDRFLKAVVKDLKARQGKSLVVAGPRQPAAVHALAHLINSSLGNLGQTVSFTDAAGWAPALASLRELAGEMSAGQVNTLVILGGNPAFTTPADLDFEASLKKVGTTIALGCDEDETAAAVKWHLPEAHYLESWSDGRAHEGTAGIIQPMIEPLFGGKTAAEVVAMISGSKDQRGHDIVRNYWTAQWPAAQREKMWRESLHNGVIVRTTVSEVKANVDAKAIAEAANALKPADGFEAGFYPSASVYDGRFANNGWMQEAPDPMTKLVWGNAALLSPATARKLGVKDGDVVNLRNGNANAQFPILIQPGHADDAVSVTTGYGRRRCGRVGKSVGFSAQGVRMSGGFWFAGGFTVTKAGFTETLATTQHHHAMEGRPIVREATVAEYKKNPKFAEEMAETPELFSLYDEHKYEHGYQWGMAIDLTSCIGCNACMLACQAENNIPVVGKEQVLRGREMHWIRMDRYYTGDQDDPQVVYQGVPCMQCENAPCENVCPVAATIHSEEGLNDMAYNRCVGTRYCANNCPYKVRRFNFLNFHKDVTEIEKMVFNPDASVRMRGVMEKCNYCVQRIEESRIRANADGRRPIRDGEIVTACQQTCPADAIVFGDIRDPNSRVSKLKKQERNYALLAELNVRPRTTYLAKIRNPSPELALADARASEKS
jgi:molybdopterin-containing oxidoreductase family iron-sulfur binding subunit